MDHFFLWLFLEILGEELCEKDVFFVETKDSVVSSTVVTLYVYICFPLILFTKR